MNEDLFIAAIFEIADMWTYDISEIEYKDFLTSLLSRITAKIVRYIDDTVLYISPIVKTEVWYNLKTGNNQRDSVKCSSTLDRRYRISIFTI